LLVRLGSFICFSLLSVSVSNHRFGLTIEVPLLEKIYFLLTDGVGGGSRNTSSDFLDS